MMTSESRQFFPRSLPVRLFNRVGKVADWLQYPLLPWDEEALLARACRRTGLRDWGEDESFRTPLRILVQSYGEDAQLTLFGRYVLQEKLVKHLTNRLLIQEELKRHPEILEVEIKRPLFIVSLPRTGSTLLFRLLAQDSACRPLLCWEALSPAPAPAIRGEDPRIGYTDKLLRRQRRIMPDFAKLHHFGARQPEECIPLLDNSLVSPYFYVIAHAQRYFRWLTDGQQDMIPTYRYYRRQLQILQYRIPTRRWLLKSPLHMYGLSALLQVFPDADIVHTHRYLGEVIPSAASMVASFRGALSTEADLHRIGQEVLRNNLIARSRAAEARQAHRASSFFDLQYADLVAEPVRAVEGLYQYFGLEFSAAFAQRIQQWLADNPKDKRGRHQYSLEQFGLTAELLRDRFGLICSG